MNTILLDIGMCLSWTLTINYLGSITIQQVVSDFYFWICIVGLLSQMWITFHLWKSESKEKALLIHPFYCSLLIDQSMSFSRKREVEKQTDKIETLSITNRRHNETVEEIKNVENRYVTANDTLRIYICATMWHETADEMVTFLKSVYKVDQCAHHKIQKVYS